MQFQELIRKKLPNVLNKHRIDRNGDGNYLIQSFTLKNGDFGAISVVGEGS